MHVLTYDLEAFVVHEAIGDTDIERHPGACRFLSRRRNGFSGASTSLDSPDYASLEGHGGMTLGRPVRVHRS